LNRPSQKERGKGTRSFSPDFAPKEREKREGKKGGGHAYISNFAEGGGGGGKIEDLPGWISFDEVWEKKRGGGE